jgi:hypothetical protein
MKGICTRPCNRTRPSVEITYDEESGVKGSETIDIDPDCTFTFNGASSKSLGREITHVSATEHKEGAERVVPFTLDNIAQGDELEIIGNPATEIKITRKRDF